MISDLIILLCAEFFFYFCSYPHKAPDLSPCLGGIRAVRVDMAGGGGGAWWTDQGQKA